MDRRPFQYSLASLLLLTTACAVLMSLAKTFPRASVAAAVLGLMLVAPLLFFLGSLLIYHSDIFFRKRTLLSRVYAPLAGLLCIIAGLLCFFFLLL